MGEAFYPEDGSDAEQLLAQADRRMYKAKRQNKGGSGQPLHMLTPSLGIVAHRPSAVA
jgi:GGDEF domain-containing protein